MRVGRAVVSLALASSMLTSAPLKAKAPSDVRRQSSPAPSQRHEQRPNVLIWILDDVGFAQLSSFGGLVQTPNIDRVAQAGLWYSTYHTAPICSASRAAILSGRMPHSVHIGGHAAAARDHPGPGCTRCGSSTLYWSSLG